MARKAEVAEWVDTLMAVDWVKRHMWFEFLACSFDRRGVAQAVAEKMSPSDLLFGLSTGKPPAVVIPLADRQREGRQRSIEEAFAASAASAARRRLA